MRRAVEELGRTHFDVLVVGAGIHGAWTAWDAALRGLSVALIDQGDFGGATSANSLKIVHGGLRYLQRADLRRMRESIRERAVLAHVAPQLMRPLPFLVPTSTRLRDRRAVLRAAFALTDLIGWDRNRDLPPALRIPRGRTVGRAQAERLVPCLAGLCPTGGAIWYDYQLVAAERLPLALAASAAREGAVAVNYARLEALLTRDRRVYGARVRDVLTGSDVEVRTRLVLNVTGPWVAGVARAALGERPRAETPREALAVNLVVRRTLGQTAVAVRSHAAATEDPVCGGHRYLFFTPWCGHTLIGTRYWPLRAGAEAADVRIEQLQDFVDECNLAWPALELTLDDLVFYHHGRLPLKAGREAGRPDALAERARIVDHEHTDRVAGLISVEGVKYTTARAVAERATDLAMKRLQRRTVACGTAVTPLDSESRLPVRNPDPDDVRHAVRHEMACTLADVVFRRTSAGHHGCPSSEQLEALASVCGAELGWDDTRRAAEVGAVRAAFAPLSPG